MSDHRCLQCRHSVRAHEKNAGACREKTYTWEPVYDACGVLTEVIEDVIFCACPYLMIGA